MRWQLKVMIAVLVGFGALELTSGQAQFGGGGFGGKGAQTQTDPLTLLRNASVKKELKLTDAQMAKVDAAIWKALSEALDDEQVKRLREIDLQVRDYRAFTDVAVQSQLKMTDKQKEDIKTIIADAAKDMADLQKEMTGGGGDFQALFAKMQSMGKETKERCTGVLSVDQKRLWTEMVGEEFKMETPKVGGDKGGFGGTKKGKGKA